MLGNVIANIDDAELKSAGQRRHTRESLHRFLNACGVTHDPGATYDEMMAAVARHGLNPHAPPPPPKAVKLAPKVEPAAVPQPPPPPAPSSIVPMKRRGPGRPKKVKAGGENAA